MAPNPKRPHHGEPLTNEQVLRDDDPRPTGTRRAVKRVEEHIPTSIFDTEADQEMQAEYGVQSSEFKPAFLYVERGPGAGQLLEMTQGTVVVGRSSVSDLRLQHPSISRRHTQIKRVGEQFFVKDLGSQNGTFVNKERIATEVEVKPGDSIAMGNALLKLRGPLARGERLPGVPSSPQPAPAPAPPSGKHDSKARIATAVVARSSGPQTAPAGGSTALKIAVFAGAVGFSLAAVLAFALAKSMSTEKTPEPTTVAASSKPDGRDDTQKLIDEAIKKKMAEGASAAASPKVEEPEVTDEPATVRGEARAPVVMTAPRAAPTATSKKVATTTDDDDEDEAPAKSGSSKRTQILAAYEKGNAESSLDAAKRAGDKELGDKLSRFLAAYDAANDAMLSNNGGAAIANFQKALTLDEQLSSGWGKYGAEIRKQLANLYVLVGMKFMSNGENDKAKTAFEGSLKHDPNNKAARNQLAKLIPAAAAPTKNTADDASGDEAPVKPAKKPAAKAAIDDAFGD